LTGKTVTINGITSLNTID